MFYKEQTLSGANDKFHKNGIKRTRVAFELFKYFACQYLQGVFLMFRFVLNVIGLSIQKIFFGTCLIISAMIIGIPETAKSIFKILFNVLSEIHISNIYSVALVFIFVSFVIGFAREGKKSFELNEKIQDTDKKEKLAEDLKSLLLDFKENKAKVSVNDTQIQEFVNKVIELMVNSGLPLKSQIFDFQNPVESMKLFKTPSGFDVDQQLIILHKIITCDLRS